MGLLAVACASGADDAPSGPSTPSTEVGKADLFGSCEGACGGQSKSGNCQCDAGCELYGDCCGDITTYCGGSEAASSCKGRCGTVAPQGCACAPGCESGGDCCADYQAECVVDPCQDVPEDGDYCGRRIGGHPSALYSCRASATSTVARCLDGCVQGAMGADRCNHDDAVYDPCTGAPGSTGTGVFCGAGITADTGSAKTVFTCIGFASHGTTSCAEACVGGLGSEPAHCGSL